MHARAHVRQALSLGAMETLPNRLVSPDSAASVAETGANSASPCSASSLSVYKHLHTSPTQPTEEAGLSAAGTEIAGRIDGKVSGTQMSAANTTPVTKMPLARLLKTKHQILDRTRTTTTGAFGPSIKANMALHGSSQALLLLCMMSFAWAISQIFLAPPLGINSGSDGIACVGYSTAGFVCVCPRETVCAREWYELLFLVFSRGSAYLDYPCYVMVFISKAHNLRSLMHRSLLSEILPLADSHHLHALAGTVVCFEVFWHSLWHIIRWAVAGKINFLWDHATGKTGLVVLLLTPMIAVPHMSQQLRIKMPFEVRKALHYLCIVWAVTLCFHAPKTHIAYIIGSACCVWAVDWLVGFFYSSRYCETLKMKRLGETAVEIQFRHPHKFVNRGGGYVYLCLPWLSPAQWHAFSLYQSDRLPDHSSMCVAKCSMWINVQCILCVSCSVSSHAPFCRLGNWTSALHAALCKPTSRPGWVCGPFPSPFSSAAKYNYLVVTASGIGTPPAFTIAVKNAFSFHI